VSSFYCEHCGTAIEDTPNGYVTGCNHYPMEKIYSKKQQKQFVKNRKRVATRNPEEKS